MTPKLLLADDSVTIQRVIELTFADEDVQVLAVGDGQAAIDRIRTERPDIVLADVGMPERDGYEVSAFVKGDPQLAHIPVLLLTGAFEPIDEVRARAVGCDGVLVKPFEPQMVISRVRDLLAGKREPVSEDRSSPAERPASPAAGPSAFEAAAGSLEDYFDRLDAALASKHAERSESKPERVVSIKAGDLSFAGWDAARSRSSASASADASGSPRSHGSDASETEHRTRPAEARSGAPEHSTNAAAPAAEPAALHRPDEGLLQEAFTALLQAEHTVAAAPAPAAHPAPISNEVIDEIVRRVIARMGDESMRAVVLDAAERLVRDEIARIKSRN